MSLTISLVAINVAHGAAGCEPEAKSLSFRRQWRPVAKFITIIYRLL